MLRRRDARSGALGRPGLHCGMGRRERRQGGSMKIPLEACVSIPSLMSDPAPAGCRAMREEEP